MIDRRMEVLLGQDDVKKTVPLQSIANKKQSTAKVHYPDYFKKKRLKQSVVDELEKTVKSDPVITDDHGEYRVGLFLHGSAIVRVNIIDELWFAEIHSENPIGLPAIKDIRYKYLPDQFVFALVLPPRQARQPAGIVTLFQIPGEQKEEGEG